MKAYIAIGVAIFSIVILLALDAKAAPWTDGWTGVSLSGTTAIVPPGSQAYILLPNAADADDISPPVTVSELSTVCMDTNHATLPGASEGAGQIEVLIPTLKDNVDGLAAAVMGTLTSTNRCVHASPGPILLRILVAPTTAGGITIKGVN